MSRTLAPILADSGAVWLATLFGSCARGTMGEGSDIDLLVWLDPASGWSRHTLWDFWDGHPSRPVWAERVSLIPRRWRARPQLDTLLLDLPEEHLPVLDPHGLLARLSAAVIAWRDRNGARKLPSFNGTHAWVYSNQPGRSLAQLDFGLEVGGLEVGGLEVGGLEVGGVGDVP